MNQKLKALVIGIKPLYRTLKYIQRKRLGIVENAQCISEKQLDFLLNTVGTKKTIIEIGSAFGQTTKRLAENNKVIAIDPFISEGDGLLMGQYVEDIYQTFLGNIEGKDVEFYKKKSKEVFDNWDGRIVDGILIDGLHTHAGVEQDFKWIKYIREGGFIAFHDVIPEFGIKQFVEEVVVPKYELVGKERALWIFRKRSKR